MLKALEAAGGIIIRACESSNISRSTFYRWMDEDNDFRNEVVNVRDSMIDLAELTLKNEMEQGGKAAVTAAIYITKSRGRRFGYVDRQEIEMKEPKPPIWFDGEEKE